MDKFRDLLPKFIQFCDKVVPLVNSGELVLPFGALTRKDAKTFKNKLKHFPEFVELLDAITRNKNFSNYFDKVKSQYDSPDWEESDATHLTDINWHAVEVIRTLLENVLQTGDPRKEFQVLSDYIDKRAIDAPAHIHVKSNLKIEMDNSMEDLDDMIKLQFKGEENKVFNYVFKTHVTVRFTDDYRDVDIERMRYEVYKILGRFITSLILMNVSIDYFRLEVVGVETYGCISLSPWGVTPNALDGLTLSSSEGLVYISEIFTRNLPPPDVNPEPESLRERTMGLPPPFKVRVLQVQFGTLKQVWRQLNELESRIKGLDKKIIVIGKRFYQMSVIRKGEDFSFTFACC